MDGSDAAPDPDVEFGGTIGVVEYDRERARIADALDPESYVRVEHVGRTAVPGLAAKDVVDVLVVASDEAAAWNCVDALEAVGYAFHREWEVGDFRLGLGLWPGDGQRFNLSVRLRDGPTGSATSRCATTCVTIRTRAPSTNRSSARRRLLTATNWPRTRT